jgi:hypothetical protein
MPRPATALCTSEAAALQAVAAMGLPATLLPLDLEEGPISLLDADTAEAVLEHRAVLGGSNSSLGLIQAGSPEVHELVTIIVVDGKAVALDGPAQAPAVAALRLAETAAEVLGAELVAVVVACGPAPPVVWDVRPVPDFRRAQPIGAQSVADDIACAIAARLGALAPPRVRPERTSQWLTVTREGMHRGVVVSA